MATYGICCNRSCPPMPLNDLQGRAAVPFSVSVGSLTRVRTTGAATLDGGVDWDVSPGACATANELTKIRARPVT